MNNGKITYHQQVSYCGKPRCRKCREGIGHGPYWFSYRTVDGRTTRTYVGKHLPPDAHVSMEGSQTFQTATVSSSDEHESQATLRIYALGQFRLERYEHESAEWQTTTDASWQHQRVRALLGCLISSSVRKLGREQALDILWPDLDKESATGRLDRAVHNLRQIFEPARNKPATSQLLLTEREVLVLANQQTIWTDADAFEQLLVQAHASEDPGEREQLFTEAMQLYGGDFLPEEKKIEVTLLRRESLQRSWIGLLLDLADLRIEREALSSAIEPLDRLLAFDPTNEAAVQRLMKLLAQLGRRGEALRAYKRFKTFLAQEYGVAPLPEIRTLYEDLRSSGEQRPPLVATQLVGTDAPRPSTGSDGRSKRDTAIPKGRTEGSARGTATSNAIAVQIGRTHQSPLVGRDEELGVLRNLLLTTEHAAKFKLPGQKRLATSLALDTQRKPQSFLLMGDVGIGKTRLAEEIGREARKRNWVVAWSRVYAQEGTIPYRLWIEVLRKAMEHGSWQRQEVGKRPLVYQPLTALLPELHTLIPSVAFPSSLPPEQEQLRLWEAACELLTIISEVTPLLIVLDDLQWADSSSCELLAYLARRVYGHPVVIVGTCRDNELAPNHPLRPLLTDLQREHAMEVLSLEPLSDEQIGTLVSQVPHTTTITQPIVEDIQTRAAGNPFFAEELARGIDALLHPGGGYGSSGDQKELPDTITAVLDLRLNRLSKACQRLLGKAAVLGGSFEFVLISAMEANTTDEDTVLDLLEEALQSGMLTEEGTGTRITYSFWHPLLVSHLYEGLSAARRASLHRRVAEVLRQAYQDREEDEAATITHHLLLGGASPQQIAHYAELAGDRAYALSAYPDAEKHYRIAIEHIENDTAHTSTYADEQMHLAYVLERLGECTSVQGSFEQARHLYERVLEIRSKRHVSISSPEYQYEAQIDGLLWGEIGKTWYITGDTTQARRCFERGKHVLREAGVVAGTTWANLLYRQSYASWLEGKYDEALTIAQEALKLYEGIFEKQRNVEKISDATRIKHILAGDPIDLGRTQVLLGLIANSVGQCTKASIYLNEALALYEQYDCQRDIAIVCCDLGNIYLEKAEYSLAQAFLRRSLSIAERVGEAPLLILIFGNQGTLAARIGDLSEAELLFKRSMTVAEQVNKPVYISVIHAYLASVLLELNRLSEARASLSRALTLSRSMHLDPYIGFALFILVRMYITLFVATDDSEEKIKMLGHARKNLQRALTFNGLEAEMQTEGYLVQAQVSWLTGNLDVAQQQALQTLEDAQQHELSWLVARTQHTLGNILAAQREQEQADLYFEQAKLTFSKTGMRLDYARTLRDYGNVLLHRPSGEARQLGLAYLQESLQLCKDCQALLEVRLLEHILVAYEEVAITPSSLM